MKFKVGSTVWFVLVTKTLGKGQLSINCVSNSGQVVSKDEEMVSIKVNTRFAHDIIFVPIKACFENQEEVNHYLTYINNLV